ncbi:unnamed protein product [Wuchereria bancrofti]|uniref:Uncharacterized protein n=1 Tax=Wuchereria bancrofti TaxID=6293 RepID=A0A3P7E557_WUCBA|nr:unnamed protein product [Wuchereria bancrofti]
MQIIAIQTRNIRLKFTLKWCKPYEIPSIIDCLEEFCDESFPEEWKPTICGLTRNNSVNSAAFPEQQNVNR